MDEWKDDSKFFSYIENHPTFFSSKVQRPPIQSFDDNCILLATSALQRLSSRLSKTHPLLRRLKEILEFTEEIQACSAAMQSEQLFGKLQPLRSWLFWMPVTIIQADEIDSSDLILLAQLYTVALAIDSSIPELAGAALGSLTVGPIRQVDSKIVYNQISSGLPGVNFSDLDEIMQLSRVMTNRSHSINPSTHTAPPSQISGAHSPYGFQHLNIGSQPSTPGFMPGTPIGLSPGTPGLPGSFSTRLSQSMEDLSNPASPFLRYESPVSRPHSQLLEASPRLSYSSIENRPTSTYSFKGESPVPSPSYIDDEESFTLGGHSPGYTGFVT